MSRTKAIIICLGTLMTAAVASAGTKLTKPVSISNNIALGQVADTRADGTALNFIACNSTQYSPGDIEVSCGAKMETGPATATYLMCTSDNPDFVRAVGTMTDSSYIYFASDGRGNCTKLIISNSSYWAPKAP